MKIFNLKLYYPIAMLLILSLMIASCTTDREENDLQANISEVQKLELTNDLLLPAEIANQGEDFVTNHIKRASNQQLTAYQNNNIIIQYLKFYGKADEIINKNTDMSDLSRLDLKKHLDEEQLSTLTSSLKASFETAEDRGCVEVVLWDPCCYTHWDNCQGCSVYTGIFIC